MERTKPEIATQKRTLKLAPAIGDWTTYKPPRVIVKKVKSGLYGFDRLSKEELNIALMIHYNFLEKLFKKLEIDFKIAVEFFAIQAEQTTYLNSLRTLTNPLVQGEISIPDQHSSVSLIIDLALANTIINSALGSKDLEPINRALTEAENKVLDTSIDEYLKLYAESFGHIFTEPKYNITNSPDISANTSINSSSTYIVFSAEVSFGENPPAKIILGYSGNGLKTLLTTYSKKERSRNIALSKINNRLLSKVTIPGTVKLGQTTLTTSEISQIEPGDVITLEQGIKSSVQLDIGNKVKIACQPVTQNNKLAVKISAVEHDEEIEIPSPIIEEEEEKLPVPEETTIEPTKETEEKQADDNDPEEDILSEEKDKEDDFADDDFDDEDFGDLEL